jgi:hypothetical protein
MEQEWIIDQTGRRVRNPNYRRPESAFEIPYQTDNQINPSAGPAQSRGDLVGRQLLFGTDGQAPITWDQVPFSADWLNNAGAHHWNYSGGPQIAGAVAGAAEGVSNWWNAPVDGSAPTTSAPGQTAPNQTRVPSGEGMSLPANHHNWGGLDLSNVGRNPEAEQYLEALRRAAGGGGGGAFPESPTFTADPAAAELADRASKRDAQMQVLFNEMRGDVKERDPSRRTGLQRFGEFLSALAASGRLEDAGMIWNEMDQRYRQEGADLRNEMRQITLAGFDSEDRAATARAAQSSAEHGARERTATVGYQGDVAEWQARESAADRAARLQISIAEAQFQIGREQREEQRQVLGSLLNIPGLSDQAAQGIARSMGFENDTGSNLVSDSLVMPARARGLQARIMSADLSTGAGRRDMAEYLRQFDPTIRPQDLQVDPVSIYNRVINAPGALDALRRNADLASYGQYSIAPAGAE